MDFFYNETRNLLYGGDTMLEKVPSAAAMTELLGAPLFAVWQELCAVIDAKYEM